MIEALLILLALALTALCAGFVAAEFSLTTVERSQVERAAAAGDRRAGRALEGVRQLAFQLSAAQLGITVTSLVIGMVAEPSVATVLRGPLEAVGLSSGQARSTALVLGLLLSTGVLMVAGELVPKNLAIARPLAVARAVAGPMHAFARTFSLLIGHLNRAANRMVRRMDLEPAEELASARTPQELIALARRSAREGVLERATAEHFVRALRLRELRAHNVMTPRIEVQAVAAAASARDVTQLSAATGFSRFPVFRDSLDDVVGVVHIKKALAVPADRRIRVPVAALMSDPLLVPESLPADELLDRVRGQAGMAVVLDEYGGLAGVASLEDVLEEIVGEIRDEHDPDHSGELVEVDAAPAEEETASGEAGADEAGAGRMGAGEAGSGQAGAEVTRAGRMGAGEAGSGQAGADETGAGQARTAPGVTADQAGADAQAANGRARRRRRWRVLGIARIHQLAALGLAVPAGPYETVAGLIAARLGRIPVVGDRIEVEGWVLRVERVEHHTAQRVEITAPAPATADPDGGGRRHGGGRGRRGGRWRGRNHGGDGRVGTRDHDTADHGGDGGRADSADHSDGGGRTGARDHDTADHGGDGGRTSIANRDGGGRAGARDHGTADHGGDGGRTSTADHSGDRGTSSADHDPQDPRGGRG